MIVSKRISLETRGNGDTHNLTEEVERAATETGILNGTITLFVVGSTAGLTTIEFEPGAVADLQDAFERVAPRGAEYKHHFRWGDDNGHSHVRAALLGPSLTVPLVDGRPTLGTWQQIVLVDFDTSVRSREVVVQIMGE
jgi:secondary thiamine-phosphate synthase enzyme